MRTPTQRQKPRISKTITFPSATGGWISNQNLAVPAAGPQGAAVLENIFPTATGGVIRRGCAVYATLGDGSLPVTAMFTYNFGNNKKFFGSTATTVYDITTISSPINYQLVDDFGNYLVDDLGNILGEGSTDGLDVITGLTGGNWIDEQFATTGGNYLVIVNGTDPMHVYDGANWYSITGQPVNRLNYDGGTVAFAVGEIVTGGTSGATATVTKVVQTSGTAGYLLIGTVTSGPFMDNEAITGSIAGAAVADGVINPLYGAITGTKPDGSPLQTSDFSYVWAYKNRLFFILKDSLDVYYLPVDQITGAASLFQLGAEFSLGGKLMIGSTWSLDFGNGLNDNCIFVTDEGEIIVYSGINPATPADWQKVGRYQMGKPRGPKAFIRAGGDLIFATSIGYVPLSQALQVDYAVLSASAVSYPIETAWNEAVSLRSLEAWDCILWDDKQMVIVSLPTINEQPPSMFVSNARTGAWAEFTNWSGTCLEIFNGRLFFGSQEGKIIEAWVTGLDEGRTYTATYVPLFTDLGNSGAQKVGGYGRLQTRGPYTVETQMSMQEDYVVNLPAPPAASFVPVGSEWGTATWGESEWGSSQTPVWQGDWYSLGGIGYSLAPGSQITSGSIVPLDAEIIAIDMSYDITDWGV